MLKKVIKILSTVAAMGIILKLSEKIVTKIGESIISVTVKLKKTAQKKKLIKAKAKEEKLEEQTTKKCQEKETRD